MKTTIKLMGFVLLPLSITLLTYLFINLIKL
jgi:hypothetical protein